MLPPVERRGTVVREHLGRELGVHSVSEFLRFLQIGLRRFAPEEIGIWRIGDSARNGAFQPRSNSEKAFGSALSCQEFAVPLIGFASEQCLAIRICPYHVYR